ncbi:hypothetical protein [Celerinatantimonas sp. YJH-8]|uniref:hypothetical protein n=1 Tax=Celerinatantimonas sp. YJH-8 TaxID=3228714 RepID=UPI0038C2B746
MKELNALLEQKRTLAAEFARLKAQFRMPTSGLLGLFTGDLNQYQPFISVMTQLMDVNDQITEVMAGKITELSEKMEH